MNNRVILSLFAVGLLTACGDDSNPAPISSGTGGQELQSGLNSVSYNAHTRVVHVTINDPTDAELLFSRMLVPLSTRRTHNRYQKVIETSDQSLGIYCGFAEANLAQARQISTQGPSVRSPNPGQFRSRYYPRQQWNTQPLPQTGFPGQGPQQNQQARAITCTVDLVTDEGTKQYNDRYYFDEQSFTTMKSMRPVNEDDFHYFGGLLGQQTLNQSGAHAEIRFLPDVARFHDLMDQAAFSTRDQLFVFSCDRSSCGIFIRRKQNQYPGQLQGYPNQAPECNRRSIY